ncbi:MAG TPA: tRNA (adenosine(37)-N6)-threonylcarbamoyltransferase complex dimerization subunit type 1 TsaB [Kofleriaceae bacterium]|nr:tRNA (adenosine(37)-N6)-threonylcarbamoyltransferase complex dimerization subunit type 1 TsaB [Kofleriaceae bacterium]
MKILGLDTATSTAGIAITDGERVLAEARHDTRGRGADLLVAIDEVCRRAAVAPGALDAIAIGAGPGSFTGLRIGMATAKGIAFAAGRPLWAVSSLAALADDAARELAREAPVEGAVICAALDARRGEVFAGCFAGGAALGPERVMAPAELAGWAHGLARAAAAPVLRFAGDAIDAYREVLGPVTAGADWLAARTPSGRAVARLALAGAHVDVTRGGAPTYIRPSEAEVKYPDGVPGALRRR